MILHITDVSFFVTSHAKIVTFSVGTHTSASLHIETVTFILQRHFVLAYIQHSHKTTKAIIYKNLKVKINKYKYFLASAINSTQVFFFHQIYSLMTRSVFHSSSWSEDHLV